MRAIRRPIARRRRWSSAAPSPTTPCHIDNFLIADPPLNQVVSHTIEAGFRGEFSGGAAAAAPLPLKAPKIVENGWRLRWGVSVFHTENTDDIINIASLAAPGFGFFSNAGTTLRQGVEAKVDLSWNRWTAYANYTFVDATFQSTFDVNDPNTGDVRDCHARRPHSRDPGASFEARCGICRDRRLDDRR